MSRFDIQKARNASSDPEIDAQLTALAQYISEEYFPPIQDYRDFHPGQPDTTGHPLGERPPVQRVLAGLLGSVVGDELGFRYARRRLAEGWGEYKAEQDRKHRVHRGGVRPPGRPTAAAAP